MKYRVLGTSGLKVSVIGFGGGKLSQISAEEATKVVNRALDLDVNLIDTARKYMDSERMIGDAIKGRRDECYIATKTLCRDYADALAEIKLSMKELNVAHIDLYQLHGVSDNSAYEAVMKTGGALEALKEAKRRGWIRHIGVTCHRDLNVMRQLIETGEFETIMVAYSPLDQENVTEIMRLAAEIGMGVIAMKPFCGGDLTTPSPLKQDGPDRVVVGSLKWILASPHVSTVIPGMQSIKEVEEDVRVGDMPLDLTDEERKGIVSLIGRFLGDFGSSCLGKSWYGQRFLYEQRCLRCYYCQPCPQGIVIPEVLRATDMYKGYPEEMKHLGIELYRSLKVKPDACRECPCCVQNCPLGLPVPQMLKEALSVFSRI